MLPIGSVGIAIGATVTGAPRQVKRHSVDAVRTPWKIRLDSRPESVRLPPPIMSKVAEILASKGTDIYSVDADATVLDAAKQMIEANVGAMLVSVDGRITGIVTERDYLRRVTLEGRGDRETAVSEIMSSPLIVVGPETSVEECMSLMTEQRIRHLPVAVHGEIVGVVSIGDVVKFTSKQQSVQIQYLTEYINAR
jgi:signal-transduction protein with cAMP-binding, CBS, and nucleotidyltransferase domain